MNDQENMQANEQEAVNNTNVEQNEVNDQVEETLSATENAGDDLSVEEKLNNELAESKDKYLRLVAEFDNFRKRTAKERIELMQTANKDVLLSMLEVLDDIDRAADSMNKATDVQALREGVDLIFTKFRSTLLSKGLKAMDSKNEDFDVELHEAITEIPAPTPEMEGKVIDEVQKGYFLNDKIVRHAKVVVGK